MCLVSCHKQNVGLNWKLGYRKMKKATHSVHSIEEQETNLAAAGNWNFIHSNFKDRMAHDSMTPYLLILLPTPF